MLVRHIPEAACGHFGFPGQVAVAPAPIGLANRPKLANVIKSGVCIDIAKDTFLDLICEWHPEVSVLAQPGGLQSDQLNKHIVRIEHFAIDTVANFESWMKVERRERQQLKLALTDSIRRLLRGWGKSLTPSCPIDKPPISSIPGVEITRLATI